MHDEVCLRPAATIKSWLVQGNLDRKLQKLQKHLVVQVGATDSEDEADTAEDLQRIEAAAAAISRRMQQTSPIAAPEEIQVSLLLWSTQYKKCDNSLLFWSAEIDHIGKYDLGQISLE